MRLNSRIPPDSAAATTLHRALMVVGARRARASEQISAKAIARALETTARGTVTPEEQGWLARVEARRAEIPFEMVAADASFALMPGDTPPGEPPPPPNPAQLLGGSWEICRWASIPPIWGRFLMRLVRELRPGCCLELGTGLGLSGAYQAISLELNGTGTLVTLEVHEGAAIAQRGFAELGLDHRVELERGLIDETLPELIDRIAPIDFAFLDAEHSEAATVRHFDAVLPHLADGAVVVLDDITQTDEMKRAWRTVGGRSRVALALGLRRVGVLVLS